jgi:hypothetical protein
VLAATLLAWPGARLAGCRPGRAATAGVLAVALLTGAVTWSGLQPTSVCDDHDAGQDRLGPLAAVEGHSLLPASTPVATAAVGQRVGLVVGLLRNCATAPLTVQAARLLNQVGEGHTAVAGRFVVTPVPPAQPGSALPERQLVGAQPLPGQVTIAPTPDRPTRALVMELRTSRSGELRVDAVTVSYRSHQRSAHHRP